ncbi:MAG: cell division protein FtsA [Caulobacteraceae bacterium]|nr:cell division protein FtsA [Caulobacteraceae bacterium]
MERPQAHGRETRDGLKLGLGRGAVATAVDLGASKVACFIMKADGPRRADRTLAVAGVAHVQSRGVRGGAIVDMDEAAQVIGRAVERAETMAGVDVQGVTVATACGQLASQRVQARIAVGGRAIGDAELAKAVAQGVASLRLAGRQPIHLRPISWSVDGQRGVADPRAMFGRSLGLDLLVVTMNEGVFQTIAHCVERAHLQFNGVVASPFASSLAALQEDEMELGAICIDMGGGSTSVAVYSGGALVHVDSLAVGGAHVTQDVARGLSTSIAGAERIKTLHGSAIASANEDREMIEAPPRGDDPGAGPVTAPRSLLKGIIAPRVEETLELIKDRLRGAGALVDPGAGVVLIGGASQLAGAREVAVRVFDRPVRLGRPRRIPHLADAAAGPAFCAAAGVLQRAAFGPHDVAPKRSASARTTAQVDPNANVVVRAAAWLRDNL